MKVRFLTLSTAILIIDLLALSKSQLDSEIPPTICTAEQEKETPCRCCKIACWYTIASEATRVLGHVPGQAGEEEAMATLRPIRSCIIAECSDVCPKMFRGLFKPI